jgi:hypothetical protein
MASAARREDLRVMSPFREGDLVRWERYGVLEFREPQPIQGFSPKKYYAFFNLDRPVPDPHGKGGVLERRRVYAPVWQLRPPPDGFQRERPAGPGSSGVEEQDMELFEQLKAEIQPQDLGEGSGRRSNFEYPD